jgi:hypothetical protein
VHGQLKPRMNGGLDMNRDLASRWHTGECAEQEQNNGAAGAERRGLTGVSHPAGSQSACTRSSSVPIRGRGAAGERCAVKGRRAVQRARDRYPSRAFDPTRENAWMAARIWATDEFRQWMNCERKKEVGIRIGIALKCLVGFYQARRRSQQKWTGMPALCRDEDL